MIRVVLPPHLRTLARVAGDRYRDCLVDQRRVRTAAIATLIIHVEADVFDETTDSVERRPAGAERSPRTEKRKRKSKAAAFLSRLSRSQGK